MACMVFLQSALPVLAPVAPVIAHFVSVRLVAANATCATDVALMTAELKDAGYFPINIGEKIPDPVADDPAAPAGLPIMMFLCH